MAPALTVVQLRAALAALHLDSRGTKDTLKKRLARSTRSAAASPPSSPSPSSSPKPATGAPEHQRYDSFLVFDVEATCEQIPQPWGRSAFAYPNEIIEWPVILLQWRRRVRDSDNTPGQERSSIDDDNDNEWELVKTAEYHSFVRPVWSPRLSKFCTDLTGITQADVDAAPTFPDLCKRFYRDFILPYRLFTPENRTVWVTDGPWDLRDFVAKTCYLSKTPRPPWLAGEIIDLRNLAGAFFASLKKRPSSPLPPPIPTNSSNGEADEVDVLEQPDPRSLQPDSLSDTSVARSSLTSLSTDSDPQASAPEVSPETVPTYLPSHALTAPANLSLPTVLSALTLPPFQGRLHSGLCDARNAARILADLARRGVRLEPNRRVPEGGRGARERRWGWMDDKGRVNWAEWSEREGKRFEREVREGKREPWR